MNTVGIDIGGTNLRIGLVAKDGALSCLERYPQAEILAPASGSAPDTLASFILSYLLRHRGGAGSGEAGSAASGSSASGESGNGSGTAKYGVAGVCVALPATIDRGRAVVLSAPNIRGFDGVDLRALLTRALGVPVRVERDVNALLTCDLRRYGVEPAGVVAGFYVGTGLGNAICIDGRLLTGSHGVAGELGHIPSWESDSICACGNRGCVETYVGGKYLDRLAREEFPDTPVRLLFAGHGGDPLLTRYIQRLAATVASEINILDPETVILGGGVLSMACFPRELLLKQIRRYTRKPLPERELRFVFSKDGGDNGVIGAGALAWDEAVGREGEAV